LIQANFLRDYLRGFLSVSLFLSELSGLPLLLSGIFFEGVDEDLACLEGSVLCDGLCEADAAGLSVRVSLRLTVELLLVRLAVSVLAGDALCCG